MRDNSFSRPMAVFAVFASLTVQAGAANATVRIATPATVKTVIAALQPGDTLKLEGTFGTIIQFKSKTYAQVVTVDASAAQINGGMSLTDVKGVNIVGGEWRPQNPAAYSMINIVRGTDISVADARFEGAMLPYGRGVSATDSTRVTVRDNRFARVHASIAVIGSTESLVTRNEILHATEDGIDVVDSHRVIVSSNVCAHGNDHPGSHPDCLQIGSLVGKPVGTDIIVLNNRALDYTQGFASFDPDYYSGLRYVFAGNSAAVSFGHGIACYGCVDGLFRDNLMIALPGSPYKTNLNVIGGSNNTLYNNETFDFRQGTREQVYEQLRLHEWSDYTPDFLAGSLFDDRNFSFVPEPATWLQFILGFGVIGALLRRAKRLATIDATVPA